MNQRLREHDSRRAQEGSAYLTVLLLLVILTIVGLSVAVITQTEVLIGGSEKQATRQLYSAGSAAHIAVALQLGGGNSNARELIIGQRVENLFGTPTTIGDATCTTAMLPLHSATCNLCMMNEDNEFKAVQYSVTATALRFGDSTLGARRTVGMLTAFEPYRAEVGGWQVGGEKPLDNEPVVDPTKETKPCEGLFVKI